MLRGFADPTVYVVNLLAKSIFNKDFVLATGHVRITDQRLGAFWYSRDVFLSGDIARFLFCFWF